MSDSYVIFLFVIFVEYSTVIFVGCTRIENSKFYQFSLDNWHSTLRKSSGIWNMHTMHLDHLYYSLIKMIFLSFRNHNFGMYLSKQLKISWLKLIEGGRILRLNLDIDSDATMSFTFLYRTPGLFLRSLLQTKHHWRIFILHLSFNVSSMLYQHQNC